MDPCHLLPGVDKHGMIDLPLSCCQCGQTLQRSHFKDNCRHCRYPVRESLFRAQVSLDVDRRLGEDVFCVKCQYNLRSIQIDGQCPECSHAVESSIIGHKLFWHQHKWLDQIRHGFQAIANAQFAMLICLHPVMSPSLFMTASVMLNVWGIWSLTTPNSDLDQTAGQLKMLRAMRIYVIVLALLGLLMIMIHHTGISANWYLTAGVLQVMIGAMLIYPMLLLYLIRSQQLIRYLKTDLKPNIFVMLKIGLLVTLALPVIYFASGLGNVSVVFNLLKPFMPYAVVILIIMYIAFIAMTYAGLRLYAERIDLCRSLAKPQSRDIH